MQQWRASRGPQETKKDLYVYNNAPGWAEPTLKSLKPTSPISSKKRNKAIHLTYNELIKFQRAFFRFELYARVHAHSPNPAEYEKRQELVSDDIHRRIQGGNVTLGNSEFMRDVLNADPQCCLSCCRNRWGLVSSDFPFGLIPFLFQWLSQCRRRQQLEPPGYDRCPSIH